MAKLGPYIILGFCLCQSRYQTFHNIILLQSIKISSPKKIKNFRIRKIMRELKNLEDTIKEINKIEELETETKIESTNR